MRRNEAELAKMRRAGKVVAEMHEATRAAAKPGVTTAELDLVARDVLDRRGATSNFLGYHGFPAVICTSPNSMIVHGIPGGLRPRGGDILSIDCGADHRGLPRRCRLHHGYRDDLQRRPRSCSRSPSAACGPGSSSCARATPCTRSGRAVQQVAESAGFSVVREYVGHAIGTAMHEHPQVPNYWPGNKGPTIKAGNVFAIEPMVNVGSPETVLLRGRLERRDRGREPLGPLRAHHRRHPRRARGLHDSPECPVDGVPGTERCWCPVDECPVDLSRTNSPVGGTERRLTDAG